jgi:pimeloyl-ACP methyl ester carboxylesterase
MPEFITTDGVRLYYVEQGHGPQAAICLHGAGGSAATWGSWQDTLDPARFRTIALDWRGHGASQATPCEFSIPRVVADVLELADHLQLPEFALVGHSFGGKVALKVAAVAAGRVTGLLLLGAVGPGPVAIDRAAMEPVLANAGDAVFVRATFRSWFQVWPRPEVDRWIEDFSRTPVWALRALFEAGLWCDFSVEIGTLQTGALVLAGRADPLYGPDYQERFVLPFLPQATLTVLECGHGLMLELPDEIAALSASFLGRRQVA